MAAEDLLKTGGAVWRSIHCSASTRMPQPNKRHCVSRLDLVERRDQARSRGKAVLGSPFGPRGRPLHALQSSLWGRLLTPCSSNLVRLNRSAKQCLFVPERRFTGAPG
jgi:hypothetical protein